MADGAMNDRLRNYLTLTSPLGPSDAAKIEDLEVAARLFDPHNTSFNTLLRRDVSVLIGRRGSGKTALLNSYKYRPYLDARDRSVRRNPQSDFRAYEIMLDVITYKHFDNMQRAAAGSTTSFRPIEAIVDQWEVIVTEYLFAKLVADDTVGDRQTRHLETLRRYLNQDQDSAKRKIRKVVWGESILDKLGLASIKRKPRAEPRITPPAALTAAIEHLEATKRRALILFDSMDEYDLKNEIFTRTLGALIRFISHFNAKQDRIKIKLGLPSEIYPEVQDASANPLKDLVSVDHISWTPMELAQIAAYRYRLFLELYRPELAGSIDDYDLSDRHGVHAFWGRFFPATHPNRYAQQEEPLTYVLRHTQLLPRQFLMIMQPIITRSAMLSGGGYAEFKTAAITKAVESVEPLIAKEILRAFHYVYPFANELCKPVFANFPTVFNYDQLEDRWRKKARSLAARRGLGIEMSQFGDMLLRMGIVGFGHDETDRYYEGYFGYDSTTPMTIGDGHELCLHPIFSRHFNSAGNDGRKAVIAKGVDGVRWS
jgi:hypothetical protein